MRTDEEMEMKRICLHKICFAWIANGATHRITIVILSSRASRMIIKQVQLNKRKCKFLCLYSISKFSPSIFIVCVRWLLLLLLPFVVDIQSFLCCLMRRSQMIGVYMCERSVFVTFMCLVGNRMANVHKQMCAKLTNGDDVDFVQNCSTECIIKTDHQFHRERKKITLKSITKNLKPDWQLQIIHDFFQVTLCIWRTKRNHFSRNEISCLPFKRAHSLGRNSISLTDANGKRTTQPVQSR